MQCKRTRGAVGWPFAWKCHAEQGPIEASSIVLPDDSIYMEAEAQLRKVCSRSLLATESEDESCVCFTV